MLYEPNDRYWDEFSAAAQEAEGRGVGMWAACETSAATIGEELGSTPDAGDVELEPDCDPSYPGVCIPPALADLDCGQIPHRRFAAAGDDPHAFDGNGDGIGCE